MIRMKQPHSIFSFVLAIIVLSFFPISDAKPTPAEVKISGRVFTEKGPFPGAAVYVYTSYDAMISGDATRKSAPTDNRGHYALRLKPGSYYMTAKGSRNGKRYFAYHGANPIQVKRENLWVAFMANKVDKPSYSAGDSGVKGIVMYKGRAVKNSHITFYTLENRRFKGIGYKTETTEDDGTFSFLLPPNKYIVIARKTAGNEIRPLEEGDLYCYYPSNPVEVKHDQIVSVQIPCYPKADRQSFAQSPKIQTTGYVTVKNYLSEAPKFGITGKITNSKGEPVFGIYVLAYKVDPKNTPALAKEFPGIHETENIVKTGRNGSYFIPLDSDGMYAVVARSVIGTGTPRLNEVYGVYKNSLRKGLQFRKEQIIRGVDITVVTPSRAPDRDGHDTAN